MEVVNWTRDNTSKTVIEAQGDIVHIYNSETEIIFSGGLMMVRDLYSKDWVAKLFIGQNLVADWTLNAYM